MALARFGRHCDVYVYRSIIYGTLICEGCQLQGLYVSSTKEDMIEHLREHQAIGFQVPEEVFDAIETEQE